MYKYLILLALLFCVTTVYADDYNDIMKGYIEAPVFTASFLDIAQVPWAEQAIETLSSYNIVQGSPDGFFYPEHPITRGEFTKVIISAFGLFDSKAEIIFSDSSPTDWHNKYIGAAVKLGISQGISENAYGVDDPIKREEMFVMTYQALKAAKLSLPQAGQPTAFLDEADISSFTKGAIDYLSSGKIISGNPSGELLPSDPSTRAEACVLILNVLRATLEGATK